MLVLSRRIGEKIVLPGLNVTVQVVGVKGSIARLGIVAPPEVHVLQDELLGQAPRSLAQVVPNRQSTAQHPLA